jgi:diguanylate cyclase (GGDEF)-like protein/PAS domain S-box-containing protein
MSSAGEFSSRRDVARAWSFAVNPTAEIPLPRAIVEECLCSHVDTIVDALLQKPFSAQSVQEAADTLVGQGIGGEQALGRTVEILGQILPRLPELSVVHGLRDKIATVLGAIATGFAIAVHRRNVADRQAWFRGIFDSAPVGMVISRLDGAIVETNEALTKILHYRSDELTDHNLAEFFDSDDMASLQVGYQSLLAGKRKRFQRWARMLTGRGDATWVALSVAVLRDAAGKPKRHVTMVQDITDQQLLEQRVRYQSLHDILTGLPNRQHFSTRLEELLKRDRKAAITIYKIDLDSFGVVTDGLGIRVGDLMLRSVAERLQSLVANENAFVARFGGDEFAIIIEESPATPNPAILAARINDELSEPVHIADRALTMSVCIGVARRKPGDTDAKELIRQAEATTHQAGRTGRGQWGLFDPIADAQDRARYALATDMPAAWQNGQVTLCYQPLVRIDPAAVDAGQTVALAALLHWKHPEHGMVSHEDGLALAEQTGLVLKLAPWMLQQACEHLQGWRHQLGAAVPPVRVDFTAHLTQHPDLVEVVQNTLAATGLQPEDVRLGLPVEPIVAGHGDTLDNVVTLAEIGVGLVLTRYGQAIGNLLLLESLPVQGVELAGPLVRTVAMKPDSVLCAALASLIPLLRRTGVTIAVADIDDTEQAYWWRDVGANTARGAAFAGPVAPEDVTSLLL